MNKSRRWKSVLMLCSAFALGCSGDDDSGADAGGTGGAFFPGTGGDMGLGTGGTTGTGGATGTGGSTMTAMPVPCGAATCTAAAPPFPGLPTPTACCVDPTAGTCGTMSGGACMPPPQPDPRCPMVMIPIIGSMPSCCASNGMCGLDASMFGMGCIDYGTAGMGMAGGFLMLPPAQRCDGSDADGGATDDAGM